MPYLIDNTRSIRWWHIPALLIALVFLHYTHILTPLENLLTRLIQPIQSRVYAATQPHTLIAATDASVEDLSKQELITEYKTLEERTQQLLIENTRLRTVIEESELLKEQIAFLEEHQFRYVNARITSVSTENISPTVIINKGASEGAILGLPVVISNGVLIGIITDVQDYSSEVRLVTNVDSRVSALLQNQAQSPGIVKGEHNLSLVMDFVPQLDIVSVYDSVFTSGADPLIPQGLLIGQVQEVKKEPSSLFQQAILKPFFHQTEISIVSFILP